MGKELVPEWVVAAGFVVGILAGGFFGHIAGEIAGDDRASARCSETIEKNGDRCVENIRWERKQCDWAIQSVKNQAWHE